MYVSMYGEQDQIIKKGSELWENWVGYWNILASSWNYGTYRRPAKAQAILRIRTVSPEPSLFALTKYGSNRRVRPKIRHLAPL